MTEDSLFWLIANALVGLSLVAWVGLTLPWLLIGSTPPVPGVEVAFVSLCVWAGWNADRITRA